MAARLRRLAEPQAPLAGAEPWLPTRELKAEARTFLKGDRALADTSPSRGVGP